MADTSNASGQDANESSESAEPVRLARRAGVIASGTLASRLLGAVRDVVMAAVFATGATDVFIVAFTIPNALRSLFGEGAASAAFVPVLGEANAKEGKQGLQRVSAKLLGAMVLILAAVTAMGILAAPWLVSLYAGGYGEDTQKFGATVSLTRTVFPYIFLMGVSAVAVGVLHTLKRFAAPAFAPALLNVALIAAAFTLIPAAEALGLPTIGALGLGALVGGVLQVGWLARSVHRSGLSLVPRWDFNDPYVRKALRLLKPLLLGAGVYQINILLSRNFASQLGTGAQSFLYYGYRIVELPQGVFALAIGTAALPTLSDLRQAGQRERVQETLGTAMSLAAFIAFPATVALVVLAEPVVTLLFGHGRFGPSEVQATAAVLRWLALGIWMIAWVRTLVPAFFAHNDTRTPVVAATANLIAFVTTAQLTMPSMGVVGLAVANVVASAVQLLTLFALAQPRLGGLPLARLGASTARILGASAFSGIAIFASLTGLRRTLGLSTTTDTIACIVGLAVGAVAFLLGARALRCQELAVVRGALKRRRPEPAP